MTTRREADVSTQEATYTASQAKKDIAELRAEVAELRAILGPVIQNQRDIARLFPHPPEYCGGTCFRHAPKEQVA